MAKNSDSKRDNARRGTLAGLLALLVGFAVMIAPLGEFPDPDFYSSAAQIIPVLLVALAVESSARELWETVAPWVRWYTFIVLAAGELAAIVASSGVIANAPEALASPENTYVGPGYWGTNILLGCTVAGLISGFLSVMYLAFFRGAARRRTRSKGK